MELYFDPIRSVVSKVVDEAGEPLAERPSAADILTPFPYWLTLPWDGRLRFHVSVFGYGVPKNGGTDMQMMSGNWLIKPDDKGKYYLQGKLISQPPDNDKRRCWKGELDLPRVLIPH